MMNRAIFLSTSVVFFIGCILLASLPIISQATMVQISDEDDIIAKVFSKNLPNKKQIKTPSLAEKEFNSYFHTDLMVSPTLTKNVFFKKRQAAFFQADTEEIGKAWVIKNLDNEYIQESLIAYKKTKQFYSETDKVLTNLTQNLLLALELEQLNQPPLLTTKPKHNMYRSVASNSEFKKKELFAYNESDNIFLISYKQIFQFETLLYLMVPLLFYPILKWFARQLFMQRY